MPGLGFKDWATGNVVTADEMDGYLQKQTVMYFASTTARDTAITSPEEGYLAYLADTDKWTYYDGSAWQNVHTRILNLGALNNLSDVATTSPAANQFLGWNTTTSKWEPRATPSGPTVKTKTADETVTSSTALQNDDHLTIAVSANQTLIFHGVLFHTSGGGDIKLAFTVPSGAGIIWSAVGKAPGTASLQVLAAATSGGALGYESSGTSNTDGIPVWGRVANGATAGNLQLQWAQNTASVDATTVKTGSWLSAQAV